MFHVSLLPVTVYCVRLPTDLKLTIHHAWWENKLAISSSETYTETELVVFVVYLTHFLYFNA